MVYRRRARLGVVDKGWREVGALQTVDEILALYAERGARDYGGEAVSQVAHALQAGWLAELSGAAPALVAAALLHDVAHLLGPDAKLSLDQGHDLKHELEGADVLAGLFPPEVTEPIRLHVAAKRYLVATDPAYAARLSPTSRQSLLCQGGPFDAADVAAFERDPHAADAVSLRRFDDGAKDPSAETPGLDHFRNHLLALALRSR